MGTPSSNQSQNHQFKIQELKQTKKSSDYHDHPIHEPGDHNHGDDQNDDFDHIGDDTIYMVDC